MAWVRETAEGVIIQVRISPRARRTGAGGVHDGRLKISLQAPPVDGKANEALAGFLSRSLGIRKQDIRIRSGERSREKTIALAGICPRRLKDLLTPAPDAGHLSAPDA